MYQLIDIEEEKSALWRRLYCSLRDILRTVSNEDCPFVDDMLPSPIKSVFVDVDDNIVVKLLDEQSSLIEEYGDEILYAIYECVSGRIQVPI